MNAPVARTGVAVITVPDLRWTRRDIKSVALLAQVLAKQQAVEAFERNFLVDLLKRNEGHMSRAAREAGVDRKTIERMVKKHGLRGTF